MSNFHCEICGAICGDSEKGYVTGCEHYPPDIVGYKKKKYNLDTIGLCDGPAGGKMNIKCGCKYDHDDD